MGALELYFVCQSCCVLAIWRPLPDLSHFLGGLGLCFWLAPRGWWTAIAPALWKCNERRVSSCCYVVPLPLFSSWNVPSCRGVGLCPSTRFPSFIFVEDWNSDRSCSSHGRVVPCHGFVSSVQQYQNHLWQRVLLKLLSSLGLHTIPHLTRQIPPLFPSPSSPFQKKFLLSL